MLRQRQEQPRENPDDPYTRGMELYRRGRFVEAAGHLRRLHGRDDAVGRVAAFYRGVAHRAIGVAALRQGRFHEAERQFRQAARIAGQDAELSAYLASVYARPNRPQECSDAMDRAASSDPDNPVVVCKLAQAQWHAGRREQAFMTLTAAIRRLGAHARLHIQVGLFLSAEERFDEARGSFLAAVDADCTSADAHYFLALSYSADGELHSAVRAFQRAFDLRPNNLMIAYHLALAARAAQQQGFRVVLHPPEERSEPAGSEIAQLATYVADEPAFVEAFLALPPSDVDADLFGTLVSIVQMALSEHPHYADLHLLCSRLLMRVDRVAAAIERAERALAINPRYLQALVHIGQLCRRAGRNGQAIEYLQRALDNGADTPDVHECLGELLEQVGVADAAHHHRQRTLQLRGDVPPAAETAREAA